MRDKKKREPRCFYCDGKLSWNNDYDFEDYLIAGEGIISVWTCTKCGAMYEVHIDCEEKKE